MIIMDFPGPVAGNGDEATSGTYTPTLTAVTNLSSVSMGDVALWMRIGSIVKVCATVQVNPVAGGATQFDMTIPIPSGFSVGSQANGVVGGLGPEAGRVEAEAVNNRLSVLFTAADTTEHSICVEATYRLV